jgi:hypothetical protein
MIKQETHADTAWKATNVKGGEENGRISLKLILVQLSAPAPNEGA